MLWFWIATSVPLALLSLAAFLGGWWTLAAFLYMTAFVHVMDRLIQGTVARIKSSGEFPSGRRLSILLGLSHFALIAFAVVALSGGSGLGIAEQILCFLAFGLFFGQVSNANAHELIHKGDRFSRRLGTWVYITLLFGHHTSAHTRVHHIWVATPNDPNSPRKGESFYRFWPRAWIGSFREGLKAETALRARKSAPPPSWTHPYVTYVGGAALCLLFCYLTLDWKGLMAYVLVTAYAQMQLLVSDYVQHYGLERRQLDTGKYEPVGPKHSWNAPEFYSSALMLNAPRHSDHHINPTRDYPSLRLAKDTMPILPRSLPLMGSLALWPRMWRRVMDPRVAQLGKSGDCD
ncbi:alkane 1-monooxygenase [Shimia haliotis]|uniref:Alkane 1-monooxygenase n=1 Tax=Shimia haliotis TaxID=1280847 RepID=A0A1I4F7M9_9RHOB|nr:alkane 1-monooxygenase [Shimia haliotis]SFL13453.1 alkane 1-monooxygenase [Shimia haliotis]